MTVLQITIHLPSLIAGIGIGWFSLIALVVTALIFKDV